MISLIHFIQTRIHSFGHAFRGWKYVLQTQKNAWIHAVITLLVILLGLWLGLSLIKWSILFLTFCMVWMAEFLNTALEVVVDLVSPDQHPLAKVGKDVGAAAVLIAASTSVVVGLLVLGPPLWERLVGFFVR